MPSFLRYCDWDANEPRDTHHVLYAMQYLHLSQLQRQARMGSTCTEWQTRLEDLLLHWPMVASIS